MKGTSTSKRKLRVADKPIEDHVFLNRMKPALGTSRNRKFS
jgi:hypothetical protein